MEFAQRPKQPTLGVASAARANAGNGARPNVRPAEPFDSHQVAKHGPHGTGRPNHDQAQGITFQAFGSRCDIMRSGGGRLAEHRDKLLVFERGLDISLSDLVGKCHRSFKVDTRQGPLPMQDSFGICGDPLPEAAIGLAVVSDPQNQFVFSHRRSPPKCRIRLS